MVEETRIIRLDTQIYDKEDPTKLNSLKDCKVCHNTALLVERKDTEELEPQIADASTKYNPDVVNIDDTEDLRTVIVNTDCDKENYQRF